MSRNPPIWYQKGLDLGRISMDYTHLIDAIGGALERSYPKKRVELICKQVGLSHGGMSMLFEHAMTYRHLPDVQELRELSLEFTVLETMRGANDRRDYFPDLRV